MYEDFSNINKLIEAFKSYEIFEECVVSEKVISIYTSKFILLVYLPNGVRIEDSAYENKKVIHLDVDVLNNEFPKVLSRIRGLIGLGKRIYARQTVVARIDKKVALDFLIEYHLNTAFAGKYRYGLFYKGELVSVAIFSGGRVMREISDNYRSFELIRFCHKAEVTVIGGISKLIKAFIADFSPHDIMTYADKDWSQYSSLQTIGFEEVGKTDCQQYYIYNGIRMSKLESKEDYDYIVTNKGSSKLKLYLS